MSDTLQLVVVPPSHSTQVPQFKVKSIAGWEGWFTPAQLQSQSSFSPTIQAQINLQVRKGGLTPLNSNFSQASVPQFNIKSIAGWEGSFTPAQINLTQASVPQFNVRSIAG